MVKGDVSILKQACCIQWIFSTTLSTLKFVPHPTLKVTTTSSELVPHSFVDSHFNVYEVFSAPVNVIWPPVII